MDLGIKKKTNSYSASVSVPDFSKKREFKKYIPACLTEDYQDYCSFCAKLKWVFNEMHQVICDPIEKEEEDEIAIKVTKNSKRIDSPQDYFDDVKTRLNHAWRCLTCEAKKKRRTFDGRQMTDEKRWNGGESTLSRPVVWRDVRSRVIVGDQKRLK